MDNSDKQRNTGRNIEEQERQKEQKRGNIPEREKRQEEEPTYQEAEKGQESNRKKEVELPDPEREDKNITADGNEKKDSSEWQKDKINSAYEDNGDATALDKPPLETYEKKRKEKNEISHDNEGDNENNKRKEERRISHDKEEKEYRPL